MVFKKEELNELKSQIEQASKVMDLPQKDFLELENSADDKFMNDIKGYVPHEKYEGVKEYVRIISDSDSRINSFVLKSEQGLGKTTIIKNILKDLKKEILYVNSYTTALSFYKLVYYNRFKVIILDDVFGLYSDEKGVAILRALTNTEKVRYIKYDSTSDKLDVPTSFIFEGSIIILTNKITQEMDNSLLGRAIYREINFTLQEKIEFMGEIAKFHYAELKGELDEIINFAKDNLDITTKNFSFRTIIKIIEFYKRSKDKWKQLALEELEKDEELIFVKSIMNKPVESRNKEWCEETGQSIRTLQRRIGELKN
jgi:hypothetical protein